MGEAKRGGAAGGAGGENIWRTSIRRDMGAITSGTDAEPGDLLVIQLRILLVIQRNVLGPVRLLNLPLLLQLENKTKPSGQGICCKRIATRGVRDIFNQAGFMFLRLYFEL